MRLAARKPRKRAHDFSREEILDTARNMFVKRSYEAVTVREIAREIGCSPGTIYLHFADKAEIFEKLCEEAFGKLAERLSAISRDDDESLECLRRAGRAYAMFGLEHPSHYVLAFVIAKHPDEDRPVIAQAGAACFGNLRNMVSRCIEEGKLRFQSVDEVSQILWVSLHGLVALLITHGKFPFLEPSRLIDRQLDILIEGIRA